MKRTIVMVATITCALIVCVSIPLHQTHTNTVADTIQPNWWTDFGPNS